MGFALHGPIAAPILADIGRRVGGRRVLIFALVIQAERRERNAPDLHDSVNSASVPLRPGCAIHADAARQDYGRSRAPGVERRDCGNPGTEESGPGGTGAVAGQLATDPA